jgi:hypothetical protein
MLLLLLLLLQLQPADSERSHNKFRVQVTCIRKRFMHLETHHKSRYKSRMQMRIENKLTISSLMEEAASCSGRGNGSSALLLLSSCKHCFR